MAAAMVAPDRQLDAEIAAQVFGLGPISWVPCLPDPDCGEWEAVAWLRPDELVGTTLQPCYNWLDTDEPAQQGWTSERFAAANRNFYWKVVPFYSSDIAAAWRLFDLPAFQECAIMRDMDGQSFTVRKPVGWSYQYVARGVSGALALCRAALVLCAGSQ